MIPFFHTLFIRATAIRDCRSSRSRRDRSKVSCAAAVCNMRPQQKENG